MNLVNFKAIPVIDMRELASSSSSRRALSILRLREACHHVGFFYLINHGISKAEMNHVLALSKVFFDLPQELKDKISIGHSPHYRGYGRLGAEITKGISDYKETYDLGFERSAQCITEDKPYLILRGPNQWPQSEALNDMHWKDSILSYIHSVHAVGKQIMVAMAQALGVSDDFFGKAFSNQDNDDYAILRLLRYPPGKLKAEKNKVEIGVGEHTDAGCLVLLLQDEVGGLQVKNCDGEWIDAPPMEGAYVVNIGEMLQRWSNNYFLATPHRVINTSARVRYSAPFFLEPNLSTVVAPNVIYGEHMLAVYQRSF